MSQTGARNNDSSTVIAAGAVVLRKRRTSKGRKQREVLLVHRPKYDDWAFPKGKLDAGEHVTTTATREVLEETGVEIRLGRPLATQCYPTAGGRTKLVHYWVGHVVGDDDVSSYPANAEIDQVRWVRVDKALAKLSYLDDVVQLQEALAEPRRTRTLVVVRHGRAQKRTSWQGPDRKRPLTSVGTQQARALVPVLHSLGVARVVTSPAKRCADTVQPYAEAQVVPPEQLPAISEEEYDDLAAVAEDLLARPEPTVVCSHRPVLPGLLSALGVSVAPLEPGEFVVLHHRKGAVVALERHLVR